MTPQDFFNKAVAAAVKAGHLWPDYAACEAALESGWGSSGLAVRGNNLFGEKQHQVPIFETVTFDTWEDANHDGRRQADETVKGVGWVKFPDWAHCFAERVLLLHLHPRFAKALAARTGADFIYEVSMAWATDALRANKVLAIYRAHLHEIAEAVAAVQMAPDPSGENV